MNENDKLLLFQALYDILRLCRNPQSIDEGSLNFLEDTLLQRIDSYQPPAHPDPGDVDNSQA